MAIKSNKNQVFAKLQHGEKRLCLFTWEVMLIHAQNFVTQTFSIWKLKADNYSYS